MTTQGRSVESDAKRGWLVAKTRAARAKEYLAKEQSVDELTTSRAALLAAEWGRKGDGPGRFHAAARRERTAGPSIRSVRAIETRCCLDIRRQPTPRTPSRPAISPVW